MVKLDTVLDEIEAYLAEKADADHSDRAGTAVGNEEHYLLADLRAARKTR